MFVNGMSITRMQKPKVGMFWRDVFVALLYSLG